MTDLLGSFGLILVASAAVFGPLAGWLAGRRERQPIVWLVFGALLGPIALLILTTAPPGRCTLCDTSVRGWAESCGVCGGPLTAGTRFGSIPRFAAAAHGDETEATLRPVVEATRSAPPTPIPLPVGRAARTRPPGDPVLSPDRRLRVTGGRPWVDPRHPAVDTGEVLATAIYFGGTARLVPGARYAIVRHGSVLRLLGPVDQDPSTVVLERPLTSLTATAVGERLVITAGAGDRVKLAIAFGAFAGANGPQLEVALSTTGEQGSDRWPASG